MNACTGACHAAMDPIGFGFEHYDGIGAFRTTDQNLPVDSNGSIMLDGKMQTFADAPALAKLLAASPQAQACFAKQMTRYALNRWDTAADAASIQSAATTFQGTPQHARPDRAVATSRTFRYRAPAPRGGAAMNEPGDQRRLIQTSKTQAKYSRRAILKRLGIGAGFLPLLSTERARAAAPSGYPDPLHRHHLDGRHLPAQLLPDRRGRGAARDAAVDPARRSRPGARSCSLLRHATKQQSPIDINVMIDVGSKYGGHFTYPAMLTGARQLAQRHRRGADHQRDLPVDRSDLRRQPADAGGVERAAQRRLPPVQELHQLPHGRDAEHAAERSLQAVHEPVRRHGHAPVDMNALIARRKSVLDYVGGELTSFAKNLGTDDKSNVMVHLDSVKSLEDQLKPATGTPATLHGAGRSRRPASTSTPIANYPNHVKFMSDIVAAAVDLRQVARGDDGPHRQRRRQQPDVPVAEHPQPGLPRHRPPGLGELRAEGGDRPVVLSGVRRRGGRQAGRRHRGQRHRPRQHGHPGAATT